MVKQYAFFINTSTCTGCKTCQVACRETYQLPADVLWRRVFNYGGGGWIKRDGVHVPDGIFAYFVSISCQHCEKPACVDACPTTAMTKRKDGIVFVDQSKCVGCRYCEWACPYGAPHYSSDAHVMTKCHFCKDLMAKGESPVCVAACPMRALDFGELEMLKAKYGGINAIEPLPKADLTDPSIIIKPHRNAQMSGAGTGRIINLPEEI